MTPALKNIRRRRQPRGFSLIELGIVIAVIAVLAAVVIFGRGFISAGRVTKAVEAANTLRKSSSTYAGLLGGALKTSTVNELVTLQQRGLVPALSAASTWFVTGSAAAPGDAIQISALKFQQIPNPANNNAPTNAVAITYQTPNGSTPQDIFNSVADDTNLVKTAAAIGGAPACAVAPGPAIPSTTVTICFFL